MAWPTHLTQGPSGSPDLIHQNKYSPRVYSGRASRAGGRPPWLPGRLACRPGRGDQRGPVHTDPHSDCQTSRLLTLARGYGGWWSWVALSSVSWTANCLGLLGSLCSPGLVWASAGHTPGQGVAKAQSQQHSHSARSALDESRRWSLAWPMSTESVGRGVWGAQAWLGFGSTR